MFHYTPIFPIFQCSEEKSADFKNSAPWLQYFFVFKTLESSYNKEVVLLIKKEKKWRSQ
jgi:hypothetical protein